MTSRWYRRLDKPSWQPPGAVFDLARRSWQLDRAAGIALLPYAAWVSYAIALTAEIARRNRRCT